jgi:hypothetical protein
MEIVIIYLLQPICQLNVQFILRRHGFRYVQTSIYRLHRLQHYKVLEIILFQLNLVNLLSGLSGEGRMAEPKLSRFLK